MRTKPIAEGSRIDNFRRLLRLTWETMNDMRGELDDAGLPLDVLSDFDGAAKDVLIDMGLTWYNPMNRYLWEDELEEHDPMFLTGEGTCWTRKG